MMRKLLYSGAVLQEKPHGEHSPLLVELPPVAWLQPQAFGNSLPSVVEWLPVPPHDLLLVNPCSCCRPLPTQKAVPGLISL